jgi:hypothetical protein
LLAIQYFNAQFWVKPMPLVCFAKQGVCKKTGMGPAHAIAHFLQTKHCRKARHGTLFFIKNCWRAGRAVVSSFLCSN